MYENIEIERNKIRRVGCFYLIKFYMDKLFALSIGIETYSYNTITLGPRMQIYFISLPNAISLHQDKLVGLASVEYSYFGGAGQGLLKITQFQILLFA